MSFKPIRIAQCWQVLGEKSFAMELERKIKKLTRPEKDIIIKDPASFATDSRIKTIESDEIRAIEKFTSPATNQPQHNFPDDGKE